LDELFLFRLQLRLRAPGKMFGLVDLIFLYPTTTQFINRYVFYLVAFCNLESFKQKMIFEGIGTWFDLF
jgi:hypothetical protein